MMSDNKTFPPASADISADIADIRVGFGHGQDAQPYKATHFSQTESLLTFKQLQARYFLGSKTRWYELMAMGEAPRPIKISRQKVAWLESEIIAWLDAKIVKRNEKYNHKA